MIKTEQHKVKVLDKISILIGRKNLIEITIGLFYFLSFFTTLFLILSFTESISYLSSAIRTFLLFSVIIFSFILLIFKILIPVKNVINKNSFDEIIEASKEIGTKFPQIKDNLVNALQLIRKKKQNISAILIEAAFEDVYKKVKDLDFLTILNYSRLKKQFYLFLFIIFFTITLLYSFTFLSQGALRILSFRTEFEKPKDFLITVITGNKNISRGNDLLLEFKAKGKVPKEIFLSTKSSEESLFKEYRLKTDSNNTFKYFAKNIKKSFAYFAFKEEIKTDTFHIKVTSPPVISKINFEIIPPFYSGLPITKTENNGNISALKGTKVKFEILASKNVLSAKRIHLNKSDSLIVSGNEIKGNMRMTKNEKYFFKLTDEEKNENENPIEYQLIIIPDNFPNIEITRPEQISLIPNNDIVSLNYSIQDDYGFSKVSLKYCLGDDESEKIKTNYDEIILDIDKNNIDQALYFNWDLSRFSLRENEILNYYLEVTDNDLVSGPKSTRSSLYKLRVPTLDELFAEADNFNESAFEELTETLKEAEELQKEFHQISNELKQNEKEISWNEKERIQESVKKFEEITNKLEEVQNKLDDMSKKLAENNLISEETMEKYNELQDLMDELGNEELRKALQDMQQSLENLLRDKVQKSLEQLSMNEENFKKSIERTLNLLKKIQIEQKVDEIIKRTENLIEDLDKLSSKTENLMENEENSQLKSDQQNIEKELDNLEKEMENLQEKMSDLKDMPLNDMEKLNEQFDSQLNQELSKEALENLQKQNPSEALKNQTSLTENMNTMLGSMQNLQQKMQQQAQQMVMQNMLKAIDNVISLSKEQESLNRETGKVRSQPKILPEKAKPQLDLRQSLDNILQQLSELSQKTFAITPEMGEALGNARNSMNESISGMQDRNTQRSTFNQVEAMKSLNEAAAMLQNSLQAMMEGGGQGGGMMSLMQQLQKMAQQQMGLNNMTQMMQRGQLTLQQQAQLQRLAQEQAAIQKSLNDLSREARESGESKKLSTNLEQILEDMKEVISGLNTQGVDDNLVKKQEKILSKLLDAQRSINDRDFEKNRESFSGRAFKGDSPHELILNDERSTDILREELLKSIEGGFSKDYQELIRRYFESLGNNSN